MLISSALKPVPFKVEFNWDTLSNPRSCLVPQKQALKNSVQNGYFSLAYDFARIV